MNQKIKQQLIEALASGLYPQGGSLKLEKSGHLCYCPLGVLCELYVQATKGKRGKFIRVLAERSGDYVYMLDGHYATAPEKVLRWAGMSKDQAQALINYNDLDDLSFKQIAAKLETDPIFNQGATT